MTNIIHINHNSPIPLHMQVEDILRQLIAMPVYENGKLLPNEVELAKRLGISRNTVRQAINKLVFEGLLIRKKGVGTKIAKGKTVTTRLDSWHSFSQEMSGKGIPFVNYDIKVSWVKPIPEVVEFFNISPDKEILKLERLRGSEEDRAIVYFISYFHPRVGLTGKEDFSRPLYTILEEDYATIASISKEEISAELAENWIAKKLSIHKGAPLLKRKRNVFDPGERPVEYNIGYYNAEHFTYSIEIRGGK